MKRNLIEVAWEITDKCNFNCIHCYNPRKREDLDSEQINKILRGLKGMGIKQIKYGGGEPLLREDFLEILENTVNLGFETTFSTNGFIVNKSLVSKIKLIGLSRVQVSLDGDENIQDYVRQNSLAYKRSINAINLFVKEGLKVSVATTLLKLNLGCLDYLYNVCSKLGVNRWRVMKYIPITKKDLMPSVEEYKNAQTKLKDFQKKSENLDVFVAREFNEICELRDNHDFQCFGGKTIMSIKANGDVSPCSYFPDLSIGNLKERGVEELWNSKEMIKFSEDDYGDLSCNYFKCCRGGCKAATFYALKKQCDPYCGVRG